MVENIFPVEELGGLAARKRRATEHMTVAHSDVEEALGKAWEVERINKRTTRLRRPKSRAVYFEDRVWILLRSIGFTHLSGDSGASYVISRDGGAPRTQLDVVAIDAEVAVVVECKSAEVPKRLGDFQETLGKLVASRTGIVRSLRSQFPAPQKRTCLFVLFTDQVLISDRDRERAKNANVVLMDQDDLAYYEALTSQVGAAARFQLLADLIPHKAVPGLAITVPALETKIGGTTCYAFSVSPEYLMKIAYVSHRSKGKASDVDTYQRMLKKSRLKKIRKYIEEGGYFPTSIVVNVNSRELSFQRGKQEGTGGARFGWLTISPSYKAAWIIDGQHRLFAYAGHPMAAKSIVQVTCFQGLAASEQARLFIDINAEQKKVSQNLLQELFAELHWDADTDEVRLKAVLSKTVQTLDREPESPFHGRILKADERRSSRRCLTLSSVFRALEAHPFHLARVRGGKLIEPGPLWAEDNSAILRRTVKTLIAWFTPVAEIASHRWDLGSDEGGGLAMNDGVTAIIFTLNSVFQHLRSSGTVLTNLSDDELCEILRPFSEAIGQYFAELNDAGMKQFRSLRGGQGHLIGMRRCQQAIRRSIPTFDPPGLDAFLENERAGSNTLAFETITSIETRLQSTIIGELKIEFPEGDLWWFNGVPDPVRKKISARIEEDRGTKGGKEENFDLVDYQRVAIENWPLFGELLGRGTGNKQKKMKWLTTVNEIRKHVMHASRGIKMPVTAEQLSELQEIDQWLAASISGELDRGTRSG